MTIELYSVLDIILDLNVDRLIDFYDDLKKKYGFRDEKLSA